MDAKINKFLCAIAHKTQYSKAKMMSIRYDKIPPIIEFSPEFVVIPIFINRGSKDIQKDILSQIIVFLNENEFCMNKNTKDEISPLYISPTLLQDFFNILNEGGLSAIEKYGTNKLSIGDKKTLLDTKPNIGELINLILWAVRCTFKNRYFVLSFQNFENAFIMKSIQHRRLMSDIKEWSNPFNIIFYSRMSKSDIDISVFFGSTLWREIDCVISL